MLVWSVCSSPQGPQCREFLLQHPPALVCVHDRAQASPNVSPVSRFACAAASHDCSKRASPARTSDDVSPRFHAAAAAAAEASVAVVCVPQDYHPAGARIRSSYERFSAASAPPAESERDCAPPGSSEGAPPPRSRRHQDFDVEVEDVHRSPVFYASVHGHDDPAAAGMVLAAVAVATAAAVFVGVVPGSSSCSRRGRHR